MTVLPNAPHPDQLAHVEQLLEHFEQLEAQFQQVREGLTHSHRLAPLGTIASIIAHEYNNILTPMISYAQMALAEDADAELMRKALGKMLGGAERAAKISSSLLGFAREADEQHIARLADTIQEAVGCLAREPAKDGIDLAIDVPDVLIAMSPLNLQQVILNLLLNARKAMRRGGGKLTITGREHGSLVHVDIADTGPGIPEQIIDRIFEPFVTHKIDPAEGVTERKGTGLGLCICQELTRNAGGSIKVTSTPGQGATFHLQLPRADDLFEST
jgi:two-component system NtrC family sensor kinase